LEIRPASPINYVGIESTGTILALGGKGDANGTKLFLTVLEKYMANLAAIDFFQFRANSQVVVFLQAHKRDK
jgi:hypothetical protein